MLKQGFRGKQVLGIASLPIPQQGNKRSVEAFKNPASFASYILSRRMAPAVQGVFVDPASPFGRLFTDMLEPASGAAK